VKTAGYGGREIRESVVVHTNDSRNPVLELKVSGKVEVFAEIRPRYLRLTGKSGESLTALVEIMPRPDYPFKIKNVRAANGQHIQLSLANKAPTGKPVYELTVKASRQAPGKISDVIHIETDSSIRPTLQVPVYGTIMEARKEPS
jgi:uncharacterized membrane protein